MTQKKKPSTAEEKAALLDEIEKLNRARQEKLVLRLMDYLDPTKEEDVRIAAHLLHISEEEAMQRFYLSHEKRKEWAEAAHKTTKEQLKEEVDRLRLDSERHRKIAETIIEIREQGKTLQEMGLGLSTTKELLKAVRKYHSIDEAVVAFREGTDKSGYHGIEPEMVSVIKIYGTPHDKAVLVLLGYYMADIMDWEKRVSLKETDQIRNSVKKGSQEDIEQYRDVFVYYQTLMSAQWMLKCQANQFEKNERATEEAIAMYEAMRQTQDFFNKVSSLIPTERKQELMELMELHNNSSLSINKGHLTQSPDGGFADEGLAKQWRIAERLAKDANKELSVFKGMRIAYTNWAKERNALSVSFPLNNDLFDSIDEYFLKHIAISEIYVKTKGEEVAEEEQKRILRDYEESEISELGLTAMTLFLDDEYGRRNL